MGLFGIFSKKKGVDVDAERRRFLLEHGRITDGRIIDNDTDGRGREIVFTFTPSTVSTSRVQNCSPPNKAEIR
jgi:hypothetical protein